MLQLVLSWLQLVVVDLNAEVADYALVFVSDVVPRGFHLLCAYRHGRVDDRRVGDQHVDHQHVDHLWQIPDHHGADLIWNSVFSDLVHTLPIGGDDGLWSHAVEHDQSTYPDWCVVGTPALAAL